MKHPLLLLAALVLGSLAVPATTRAQQYHYNHQHGPATSRHCQTDYDHRPHTYHSGTHYHYCPGGAHDHRGYIYGGVRRASNYDPVVADIQRTLQNHGHYAHSHHQADGIYGPETAAAIRSFQQARGLPVTGMIDAAVLTALGLTAPTYTQPGAVPPLPVSPPAVAVPPGYKLVPIEKPVEKIVVPDGFKLVPIDPPAGNR